MTQPQADWHALGADETMARLGSDAVRGLSAAAVQQRQAEFGPHAMPEPPPQPAWRRLARQCQSPLVAILVVAALLAVALGHLGDAGVILVVVVNAVIGLVQEGRAERSMAALRRLDALQVHVRRDGREQLLPARELVPGDLLLPAAGDEVAAGAHTEIGRVAGMTQSAVEPHTPLEQRIHRFGRWLVAAGIGLFAVVVLLDLWRQLPLSEVLMVAISQMVSMVPEGLPVAMTIALAMGMQRMAARGAIIRRLSAVETLGSTTVICSDKTGTLTLNRMTAVALWLPADQGRGRHIEVSGSGTEVAKSAARIVISDDNFATIVAAIERGRVVYDNPKKVILYLFATSVDEVLVLLMAGTAVAATFGWFVWRSGQAVPLEQLRTETFTVLAMCQ